RAGVRLCLVPRRPPGSGWGATLPPPPHQDRDPVAAADHAAIDADVHDAALGILGDDAGIGDDVAAAVEPVPIGDGKRIEIDGVPADDVFLTGAVLHDLWRDPFLQQRAADPDQLPRMALP